MRLDRTLIIAPHPDDDVIGAGGLMQRVLATGGELQILYVTDGENNPWPQRWMHKKWSITTADRDRWGAMRREEAHCSLSCLGLGPTFTTFLGLPDGGLASLLRVGDLRLLKALRKSIAGFQPTLVVSPSSLDLHADHRAIASAAHIAVAGETPITTYIVHGRGVENRVAVQLELTDSEQQRKRAAIECHRSQLLLSRRRFLSYVQPNECFSMPEFDLIGTESSVREWMATLQQALGVVFGSHPTTRRSGVKPPTHVKDSSRDVPGLL